MSQFDIVIVGGGMVGAAAALALAQQGFHVGVIEKTPPQPLSDVALCEVRVSAITAASEQFLRHLGVWDAIAQHSAHPFTAMYVWSDDTTGEVVFRASEVGVAHLGHVVPNAAVQAALWQALTEYPSVTLHTEVTLEALSQQSSYVTLTLSNQDTLQARLVIGADGAFSQVRALAHIPLDTHAYGQAAIVGCVRTEKSHEDACWQRYTQTGPVAFLAMRDNLSSLAWYVPEADLADYLSLPDEDFAQALTEASDGRLGEITWVGPRAGFPLVRRHAQKYVAGSVVLVGDAAHTIHPQAGQGVNLGFLDVVALTNVLSEAKQAGMPWYAESVLRRYVRRRYADNVLVQRAMDGFDALFAHDFPWKRPLRQGVLTMGANFAPARILLTELALFARPGAN
jgi:2-octaprenylphenol hydroxylase